MARLSSCGDEAVTRDMSRTDKWSMTAKIRSLAVLEESHAVDFQKEGEGRGREGIITTNKISSPLLLLLHHHDPVLTLRITHANKRGGGEKGVC